MAVIALAPHNYLTALLLLWTQYNKVPGRFELWKAGLVFESRMKHTVYMLRQHLAHLAPVSCSKHQQLALGALVSPRPKIRHHPRAL